MTGWLELSDQQRKITLEQASLESGLKAEAIEKDWWVTLVLKALFEGKFKNYLTFKGGTSLSKCWGLINRFSEDIDLILDTSLLGITLHQSPSGEQIKRIRKVGFSFTSNELKNELDIQLYNFGIPKGIFTLKAEPFLDSKTYPDPQVLKLKYPTLFQDLNYIVNEVKIEIGVRSMQEPKVAIHIQSLLNSIAPNKLYRENKFEVSAIEPQRTFLEKIFLLHEEFKKPDKTKIRSERMSRHLYDLSQMQGTIIETSALKNEALYQTIIQHRKTYNKLSGIDYSFHQKPSIDFIPPRHLLEAYRKDYEKMREEMIYGDSETFDDLIKLLGQLKERIRKEKPEITN